MFSKKIITSLLLILCIIFAEIAWEKFCSGSIQLFSFLTEDNGELPKKQFSSVQFSHSVVSDCLWPNELQHTRLPCPSSAPRACSNLCPLSWWCHPTISSSVIPFSSCPQSFPTSGSFPVSQFFESGGQIIGVSASASILPMNIQDLCSVNPWSVNVALNVTFNILSIGLPRWLSDKESTC